MAKSEGPLVFVSSCAHDLRLTCDARGELGTANTWLDFEKWALVPTGNSETVVITCWVHQIYHGNKHNLSSDAGGLCSVQQTAWGDEQWVLEASGEAEVFFVRSARHNRYLSCDQEGKLSTVETKWGYERWRCPGAPPCHPLREESVQVDSFGVPRWFPSSPVDAAARLSVTYASGSARVTMGETIVPAVCVVARPSMPSNGPVFPAVRSSATGDQCEGVNGDAHGESSNVALSGNAPQLDTGARWVVSLACCAPMHLAGTTEKVASPEGVALFSDLSIQAPGRHVLVARARRLDAKEKVPEWEMECSFTIDVCASCIICYEGNAIYPVTRTCAHYACRRCARASLEHIMAEGMFPARCPACRVESDSLDSCIESGTLNRLVMEGVIDQQFADRFENQQVISAYSDPSELVACPGCHLLSVMDDLCCTDFVRCPHCLSSFCTSCAADHSGRTCEEFREQLAKSHRESASHALVAQTSKQCPFCGTRISHYRGHGCHHIVPGTGCPGCHLHFCYVCLEEYPHRPDSACYISVTGTGLFCDDRCDCQPCPLCSPGFHCDMCDADFRCTPAPRAYSPPLPASPQLLPTPPALQEDFPRVHTPEPTARLDTPTRQLRLDHEREEQMRCVIQ